MPRKKQTVPTKPVPKNKEALDWLECQEYIEAKYNIKLRGYKPEHDSEYRDFWHWIMDHNEIHNGCYFYLTHVDEYKQYGDRDGVKWWVVEILQLFADEFDTDYFWVSW